MIANRLSDDQTQPTPKLSSTWIVVEFGNESANSEKHILHHIACVRVLQTARAAKPVDWRPIQVDETSPSVIITRGADADQQTDVCGRPVVRGAHQTVNLFESFAGDQQVLADNR